MDTGVEYTYEYRVFEEHCKFSILKITSQQTWKRAGDWSLRTFSPKAETKRETIFDQLPEKLAKSLARFLNNPKDPENIAKALAATYRSLI